MNDSFDTNVTTEEHEMSANLVGVIREVLNNIVDYRDIIRELLSNSCAWQVEAKNVKVSVWGPDQNGLICINVSDDGCGMDYTKDTSNPGRLDKFLNIAYAEQSGFSSDEFGSKGLGTILIHNSRYVKLETSTGGDSYYEVHLNDPMAALEKGKYLKPEIRTINRPREKGKGTEITIAGYADLKKLPKELNFKDLARYLQYKTVCGFTQERDHPLPEITLNVSGVGSLITTGFNFIDDPVDARTVVFGPKKFTKSEGSTSLTLTMQGGVTMDTKKYQLSNLTGGIFISHRGVPYFTVDGRHGAYRILGLTPDFVRIIVKCDDVPLNTARSDFNRADKKYKLFESALVDAMQWVKALPEFDEFIKIQKYDKTVALQKYMSEVKEKHSRNEVEFVWFKGERVLSNPTSEYEVASILWKLESIPGGLPFYKFETLAYPGKRKGIDLLVNYQEDEPSEYKYLVYVELERKFSGFFDHKHDPRQATALICWTIDTRKNYPGEIHPVPNKQWKVQYRDQETTIPVYIMSKFPHIKIGLTAEDEED